jgi:hypothetical protein
VESGKYDGGEMAGIEQKNARTSHTTSCSDKGLAARLPAKLDTTLFYATTFHQRLDHSTSLSGTGLHEVELMHLI